MSVLLAGSARSGLVDWGRVLCPAANCLLEVAEEEDQQAVVELALEEPGPGGGGAMSRGLPGRRVLQALVLVLATAYATVLLYQAVAPRQWIDDQSVDEISGDVSLEMPLPRLVRFGVAGVVAEDTVAVTPSVATATIAPFSTDLDDVFISVKTTRHYHHSRLPAIINTWFQFAKDQTWFFTDRDDPYFHNQTNGHMINTKCSSSHSRRALCCKMSVEFDRFLESSRKWFCHFDDDNYVNVPRLLKLLDNYNPREDWYLGRPSIPTPLEIVRQGSESSKRSQKVRFWFATGGAGFCISRALALKMTPVAGGGKFITVGDRIRLPDDVTMGYIIEHMLKKQLTVIDQFHSHLEILKFLNKDTFHDQVSFSYSKGPRDDWNIVKIDGFSIRDDPKRFKSLHCHLFPQASNCPHR
ncbi:PREDICTED: fringe glycosyltransferase isoform X1 [Ceratosolen solmsi marchali]|uniref:Fringe glycosyltransferase isoform X1 n=1 Tax=Ceratosolen solmsi marchali TaxID=326594 RepID=A0AAJ7DUH7_9HYME|nr:PREDICTED: fringe glycosyltransferase isoform X1 [Ceratosolen solmsi marchali]